MTTQYKAEFLRGTIHPNFSRGETDKVLVSMILTYPLCIHGEVMTYRRFARNSASLRAIPTAKIIEMVEANPFIPEFTKNQKGMAANYWITGENRDKAEADWMGALRDAIAHAKYLADLGVAKQDVNRLLAPFMWNTIIATAPLTDWLHLLNQRLHKDADPKIQRLAKEIRTSLNEGKFEMGDVHFPFGIYGSDGNKLETGGYNTKATVAINTVKCARVSYLKLDDFDLDYAYQKHDELMANGHWSPFDHIAIQIDEPEELGKYIWNYWKPYRETLTTWKYYCSTGITEKAKENGITLDLF